MQRGLPPVAWGFGTASEPRKFRGDSGGLCLPLVLARAQPPRTPQSILGLGMRRPPSVPVCTRATRWHIWQEASQCSGYHRSGWIWKGERRCAARGAFQITEICKAQRPQIDAQPALAASELNTICIARRRGCNCRISGVFGETAAAAGGGYSGLVGQGLARGGESTNLPCHSRPWRPAQFGGVRLRHQCAYPAQGRRQGARAQKCCPLKGVKGGGEGRGYHYSSG